MKKILIIGLALIFVGCNPVSNIKERRSTEDDKYKEINVALNIKDPNETPQIEVLEFFDFDDGNYEESFKVVEEITAEFDKNIIVEKHHLPQSDQSFRIAEISECARDQD